MTANDPNRTTEVERRPVVPSPGPWSVSSISDLIFNSPDGPVGFVYGPAVESPYMDRARADCRLIAAAPDLLAALKELLASQLAPYPSFEEGKDAQDAWSDRRAKARNDAAFVVAKAEGRS